MEKKENASKLISSLVALSLATTLGVPTIALADQGQDATPQPAAQQQAAEGASENGSAPLGASETPTAQQSENASTLPTAAADGVITIAESGTYSISKDTTASIVVNKDIEVTLNIDSGKKLTNADGKHTITNNGTLTITGEGTVDNVSHGCGALVNEPGGTAMLNGCTFTRSKEAGTDKDTSGGNSWYTIKNYGTMTIGESTVVTTGASDNVGKYSSLIANGWQNGSDLSSHPKATGQNSANMTINGGAFSRGLNTVKNDDYGVLAIKGGTFTNYVQAALQNHGVATISNGNFNAASDYAVYNCPCDKNVDKGELSISGGDFKGTIYSVRANDYGFLKVTGGTFSSKPDARYIASGYEAVGSDTYTVQRISSSTPAPAPTTETTTTTNPDGTTTTTVTDKKTGESTSTTEGANGTIVVEKTDASGNTTTKVTVPEGAATNAGAPVEIPAAVEVTKGKEVSIYAPAGTIVAIPAAADAGNVAVIVHADGTETVIPMSLVEGGKAIVKIAGNETIKIIDNAKEFVDVPADHWAAGNIDFASSHEIFKGIGNGDTYEPETALTRNMMMTVLARTDGADTSDSDPWYAKGQQWAVDNGVSNGLWGEDSITREQLVTMLFNYANKSGMDTSARADVSGMENADAVSDWALEAVQWAVAEGILKGVDNTDLAPQGLATRAQAAAFMQRYVKTALL